MRFEHEIVPEIEAIVNAGYSDWYIGMCDHASRRNDELDNPDIWHEWEVVTPEAAKNIVKYFFLKGVQLDACTSSNPRYIYIFVPSESK